MAVVLVIKNLRNLAAKFFDMGKEKTTKKAVSKSKTAPKKVAKPAAKKAVAKPAKKAAPAKKTAKPAPKKAAKPVAKKVVKPVAKKAVKPVAKVVAKKAAKPITKKATAKKAVAPAKKVAKPVVAKKAKPTAKVAKPAPKKAVKPAPKVNVVTKKITPNKVETKPIAKPAVKPTVAATPKKVETTVKKSAPITKPNPTNNSKINQNNKSAVNENMNLRYSDEDLKMFKDLIDKKLEQAREELKSLKESLDNHNDSLAGNKSWNMEEGTDTTEMEYLMNQISRQHQYIKNLEAALVRIENKTYGICRVTGKLIPKERLRLVPHATLSVEAKMNRKPEESNPTLAGSSHGEDAPSFGSDD
jgi:RNA polymerase-binding transcription factor DksA